MHPPPAIPLLLALWPFAPSLAQSPEILYPEHRFFYAYPSEEVEIRTLQLQRHELNQDAVPAGSIQGHAFWSQRIEKSAFPLFADGEHTLLVKKHVPDDHRTHTWNFFAALGPGYAVKWESSHHRTARWGLVHSWKHFEWGGGEGTLPEELPVFAVLEGIYGELVIEREVRSITKCYRVSHLRATGAGEDYIGDLDIYIGGRKNAIGEQRLAFEQRNVNFSINMTMVGGKPVFTWKRGRQKEAWRSDPVLRGYHQARWRTELRTKRDDPPEPRPPESRCFTFIGDPARGLEPAEIWTVLDWRTWDRRKRNKLRPLPLGLLAKRKVLTFTPVRRKHTGFVSYQGGAFWFRCKPWRVKAKLDVPDDLSELLAAWVANFPTKMSQSERRGAWRVALGKKK